MNTYQAINDHIVPITRFNKGESGKVFEEVGHKGIGIVMKNNHAECIMLSPKMYDELIEAVEDSYWTALGKERESNGKKKTKTMKQVAALRGITAKEVEEAPDVEID